MKRLALSTILVLILLLSASAQTPQNTKRVIVSGLPAAADNTGKTYVVTDSSTTSDCTVGGGSLKVRCTSDGTNWVSDTADYVPKTLQVASNALNGDISTATLKSSLSLNNVDNTADTAKPVSTAQQTALDLKANLAGPTFTGTPTLPTGTITSGSFLTTAITAPGTPAAGKGSIYVDSTSKNLSVKDDAGVVKHGVRTKAAVSNSFVTAIDDDGTVTVVQPAFSNLSGTATAAQIPAALSSTTSVNATTIPASKTLMATDTSVLAAQMPALTGDVTTSAGAVATTIANSAVTRGKADSTVNGIGVVSTVSVNGVAATDTQLLEVTLPAAYLNRSSAVLDIKASGTWTTGTTQTPTQTFKVKLCTVSGCGSGTVLTLVSWTSAAATASTTQTWLTISTLGTVTTGSSGTVIAHGFADLPVGASANTAFAGFHDVNTAASSGIDLTAQLFLNLMWNVSTQSGTKNSAIGHMLSIKSRD